MKFSIRPIMFQLKVFIFIFVSASFINQLLLVECVICQNYIPSISFNGGSKAKCFDGGDFIENIFDSAYFNPESPDYHLLDNRWNNMKNCSDEEVDQNSRHEIVTLNLFHVRKFPFNKFINDCYPLSPRAFQRSLKSPSDEESGGDQRLMGVIRKVLLGQDITIVTIGGSVALGTYSGHTTDSQKISQSSSYFFFKWLEYTYPKSRITYVNLAVGGTDSYWRLSHLQEVADHNPDLVIYDYIANDMSREDEELSKLEIESTKFATLTETMIRAIYELPRNPAIIQVVFFRAMNANDSEGDRLTRQVIEPMGQLYKYTIASFRDAIWPVLTTPPPKSVHLVDEMISVHPPPHVQQLIADTIVYAWVNTKQHLLHKIGIYNDDKEGGGGGMSITMVDKLVQLNLDFSYLEQAHYRSEAVELLKSCKVPESVYEANSWSEYKFSNDVGSVANINNDIGAGQSSGWHYMNTSMKNGWQFEVHPSSFSSISSPSSSTTTSTSSSFPVYTKFSTTCGWFEPISFRLLFGEAPTLLISYLKSYEHFGRAIVFIDDNENKVVEILKTQDSFFDICTKNHDTRKASRMCNEMMLNKYDSPFILDGHWNDHSSQTNVAVFKSSFKKAFDIRIRAERYAPSVTGLLTTPGWHTVTIALLKEGVYCESNNNHHVEGGSGVRNYTRFKVLGIRSC
jgi:hypothetical protein